MKFLPEDSPMRVLHDRRIALWLYVVCGCIFIMLIIGGMTRLTHSGLSIVEWKPLIGTLPPLSESAWLDTFGKYQQTPEYLQKNFGMSLEEFKSIFWLEYVHRLWGRTIGLIFFVPFLWFLLSGSIRKSLVAPLAGIFLLGGLQGGMGWFMVKSGLVDNPAVSQYRLTAHLLLAFLIYGAAFWLASNLRFQEASRQKFASHGKLLPFAIGLLALLVVTVASGGFVAGLKAALAYNTTFPTMDGEWIPTGYLMLEPWYLNFFDNIAAVQFDHRWLAIATFVLVHLFWLYGRTLSLQPLARLGSHLMLGMVYIQLALGIGTLLMTGIKQAIPVHLGTTHQAGAMVLFTFVLFTVNRLTASRR